MTWFDDDGGDENEREIVWEKGQETERAEGEDDSELAAVGIFTRVPREIRQSMKTLAAEEGVSLGTLIAAEHVYFLQHLDEVRGSLREWEQQWKPRAGAGD